jgi:hypothetical protein
VEGGKKIKYALEVIMVESDSHGLHTTLTMESDYVSYYGYLKTQHSVQNMLLFLLSAASERMNSQEQTKVRKAVDEVV